jgi:ribosome-associated toxin RatA of RatAB toxin-antitoxin module
MTPADLAERTTGSITIAASPADVLAVIADVAAYPAWAPQVTAATVLERDDAGRPVEAGFSLSAGVVTDDYVLRYTWADTEVSWRLVRGRTIKAMDGMYRVRPAEAGSVVDYELRVALDMPLGRAFRRKAERVVVDTALRGLKRHMEA